MGAEVAIAAMVVGAGMQAYGTMEANRQSARANKRNAAFYREQEALAIKAAERDQYLFDRESDQFLGAQVNAFAKAGVELSASALLTISSSKQEIANESAGIMSAGKIKARMAGEQASQASNMADRLGSFTYNLLTVGGPALSSAGSIALQAQKIPSKTTNPSEGLSSSDTSSWQGNGWGGGDNGWVEGYSGRYRKS